MPICTASQIVIINASIANDLKGCQTIISLLHIKPIIPANELNENLGHILE